MRHFVVVPALLLFSAMAAGIASPPMRAQEPRRGVQGERARSDAELIVAGHTHLAAAAWRKAEECFERGITIATTAGDRHLLMDAHLGLGLKEAGMSAYEQALGHLQQALRIAEELSDRRGIAAALRHIGVVYACTAERARAIEHLVRSLAISEELRDSAGIAEASYGIGLAHASSSSYLRALEHYERCLIVAEATRDRLNIARGLRGVGSVRFRTGYAPDALAYFEKCLAILEDLRYAPLLPTVIHDIGLCREFSARRAEAVDWYQRSLRLAEEIGDRRQMAIAFNSLGRQRGYAEAFRDAEALFDRSIGIAEAIRARAEIACTLINNKATCLSARGEEDEALALLLRASAIADSTKASRCMLSAREGLAAWYRKRGDFELALAYTVDHAAVRDSIYGAETTARIAELGAKYESERKDHEILLLAKDTALAALQLQRQRDALLRQRLIDVQHRQQIALLAHQRNEQVLELARKNAELGLHKLTARQKEREVALLSKDVELTSSQVAREQLLRNSILGGLLLLCVVGLLGYWRLQGLKREASLRAESTEAKARLAEARAAALETESERREKEAQRQLTRRLLEAQEREHRRIAADLHDGLGQGLLVIKNGVYQAMHAASLPDDARGHLDVVTEAAESSLGDLRQIVRDLRPAQLDRFGLAETIRAMLHRINDSADVRFTGIVEDIDGAFEGDRDINVYRIVQEAVNNIVKHAGASEATVRVLREDGTVRIEVKDNGRGFDPISLANGIDAREGFGLQGMAERVRILDGRMHIDTGPGRGTRLTIALPANG